MRVEGVIWGLQLLTWQKVDPCRLIILAQPEIDQMS